jgi:FixJ family two-component response regulator
MPGLSGLDLQEALARQGIHRPVIFLTGQGTIPESVKAMKAGAVDYLTKPVDNVELLSAISWLRNAIKHGALLMHGTQ